MAGWFVACNDLSKKLGTGLANLMDATMIEVHSKIFPDGEGCIRIQGDLYGNKVLLVHSMYPDPDKRLTELLLMAHKLSEEGAEVYGIIPYLAYARQHRVHHEGTEGYGILSTGIIDYLDYFTPSFSNAP